MDYIDSDINPLDIPEPGERKIVSDFPPVERLYTYGVDYPLPESLDDLRCKYNEDERAPLTVESLGGYKVPPLGLKTVAVHGGGFQPGGGWIYPPGTFRENKHTIGKELGASIKDIRLAAQEARKDAWTDGLRKEFEARGLAVFDNIKDKEPQAIEALVRLTLEYIIESKNAKEARLFLGDYTDRLEQLNEGLDKLNNMQDKKLTMEDALKLIDKTAELMEQKKGEIIEAKAYDVGGAD